MKTLSFAVVYEDADAHLRAAGVYELLLRELGGEADLTASWWRATLLSEPKFAGMALRAVVRSELIILSFRGEKGPPESLQAWVESWPTATRQRATILPLLQLSGNVILHSQWDSYLTDVAARKNMVYLPNSAGSADAFLASDPSSDRTRSVWSGIDPNRLVDPYLHWGLNE